MKTAEILKLLDNNQKKTLWEAFRLWNWNSGVKLSDYVHNELQNISVEYRALTRGIEGQDKLNSNTAEGILNKLERKFG